MLKKIIEFLKFQITGLICNGMKHLIKKSKYGLLINKNSLWVGIHYSNFNKRWCINIFPMITIWFIKKSGKKPYELC